MASKSFKILYYTTQLKNSSFCLRDAESTIKSHLTKLNHLPYIEMDSEKFQIRDLDINPTNGEWRGIFGRLRNDAPNVIDKNDRENTLNLSPDDLLIEKVHFIYKSRVDTLIWQVNPVVGFIGKFEFYLSQLLNEYLLMKIIAGTSSLNRVINGVVKYYEVKVASPTEKLSKVPKYNQAAFDIMNDVDGSSIKYRVSAGREHLSSKVKELIKKLVGDDSTESLKVKLDGDDEPVDMFLDRISKRVSVTLNGHYPDTKDIFNQLNLAFEDQKPDLKGSFH